MIRTREQVRPICIQRGIPEHMHGAVERYLFDRIDPGSFLTSALANDLVGAAGNADHMNQEALLAWAMLLYNDLPRDAWGSYDVVSKWLSGPQAESDSDE